MPVAGEVGERESDWSQRNTPGEIEFAAGQRARSPCRSILSCASAFPAARQKMKWRQLLTFQITVERSWWELTTTEKRDVDWPGPLTAIIIFQKKIQGTRANRMGLTKAANR